MLCKNSRNICYFDSGAFPSTATHLILWYFYKIEMVAKHLYAHFGCEKGECLKVVKKKAMDTILKVHPDKHPNASDRNKKLLCCLFDVAKRTRNILCDRLKRSVYNELLRMKALPRHGGIKTNFNEIDAAIDSYIANMTQGEYEKRMGLK